MINTTKHWQWFPSEAISWQSVVLPKGRRWREALTFAVEEKLAQSIEAVHIVPTAMDDRGERWVAVIGEEFWKNWQPTQKESVSAYCPDVLALPWSSELGITALIEDDRVRLRWGRWQGAAGDIAQMSAVISLLQSQSQQTITVYAHQKPEAWQCWQLNWHPLTSFVAQLPSFDLREGAGSAWLNLNKLKTYRLPVSLASLLLIVWFSNTSLLAWQAQQQTQAIKQQTQAQFVAAFPDIKRRVNPLVQAKSELTRRQAASKEQAVSLMSAVQVAQHALGHLAAVNQLDWQQGKLRLSWVDAISDSQRESIRLESPWQLQWLSPNQCELFRDSTQ